MYSFRYAPLRAAGSSRALAVVACFAGSGALHVLPFVATGRMDVQTLSTMMLFFILQCPIVMLERATGVKAGPVVTFAVVGVLALALFVRPTLEVFP